MHILDVHIFVHILDVNIFLHMLGVDIFSHMLDVYMFMYIFDIHISIHVLGTFERSVKGAFHITGAIQKARLKFSFRTSHGSVVCV